MMGQLWYVTVVGAQPKKKIYKMKAMKPFYFTHRYGKLEVVVIGQGKSITA